jgi:hypothetical protein
MHFEGPTWLVGPFAFCARGEPQVIFARMFCDPPTPDTEIPDWQATAGFSHPLPPCTDAPLNPYRFLSL